MSTRNQPKGGSALKRLKASLKTAGYIGPNSRQATSKKKKKQAPAGADREKEERRRKLARLQDELSTPFEIRTSKLKHEIVGRKVKGVEGRPGLSKQVGNETRKKTLLVELERREKSGGVVDRRFGEKNPELTSEERMLERFTRERQKQAAVNAGSTKGKRSLFNLEDDEGGYGGHSLANDDDDGDGLTLTHSGRSLADIDDFDAVGLSDDEENGQIDKDTVSYDHFGGFDVDGEGRKKSKAEVMKEVIAKSKFHKHERQKQHEEDDDLVRELDDDLDELRGLLAQAPPPTSTPPKRLPLAPQSKVASRALMEREREQDKLKEEEMEKKKTGYKGDLTGDDKYDRFVRELALDRRSKPTDRMKTEEEIAAEEKAALENAERARKRRMEGLESDSESEEAGKRGNKSKRRKCAPVADDLEDDFMAEETEASMLGKGLTLKILKDGFTLSGGKEATENDESEEGSEDEDIDGEDDGSDEVGGEESDSEESQSGEDEEGSEEEDEDEDDDEDEDTYSDIDDMSGLASKDGGEDDYVDNDFSAPGGLNPKLSDKTSKCKRPVSVEKSGAAKELPYTFAAPTCYEDFAELAEDLTLEDLDTIVRRIRVLYHIKLAPENKQKLEILMNALIDHVNLLAISTHPIPVMQLKPFYKHIIELGQLLPDAAAKKFLEFLVSAQASLKSPSEAARWPNAANLLMLRALAGVFPTSDLVHPVATPATLFIAQCLGQGVVSSLSDLGSGLFLCSLVYEYQSLSKRFVPESVSFVVAAISMLKPKSKVAQDETPGIFPAALVNASKKIVDLQVSLVQDNSAAAKATYTINFSRLLETTPARSFYDDDENMKMACLAGTATLLAKFAELHKSLPSYHEIFVPVAQLLKRVVDASEEEKAQGLGLPEDVKNKFTAAIELINRLGRHSVTSRKPLLLQKHKPLAIPTYLPKFEEGYSMDHHYDPDAERQAMSKLKAQHRREKKGAVRELRRDAQFLNSERLKKQREKDAAYQKKIRGIEGALGEEEGRAKKMERVKERDDKRK